MQRKRTGLVSLHCAVQRRGEASGVQGILEPQDCAHPGQGRGPVAQGPGHAQPGQRRLTGFWAHRATEEPLLAPLSLGTGCHYSNCGSF